MALEEASWTDDEVAGAEKDYDEELDEYWTEPKELLKSGMTDEELEHYEQSQAESKKSFNEFLKNNEGDETNDEATDTETNGVNGAETNWIAYMGHIAHSEIEYLMKQMEKLEAPYVMGAEVGKYQHFHFLAKISNKQYHNFCQRVFIKKYKLRGRATKDKPRQYGKVAEIKDLARMMSYTLKDKNFKTNMTTANIELILKKKISEVSNTKKESREIKDKMMEYVNNHIKEHLGDYAKNRHEKYIRIAIIRWLKEEKRAIMKSTIERHYWYYVANTTFEAFNLNEYVIYHELYSEIHA